MYSWYRFLFYKPYKVQFNERLSKIQLSVKWGNMKENEGNS